MKNDKTIDLDEKDFSYVCPMKREDMTAVEGGYFCGECNKKVHDVSNMTKSEYEMLVSKTENVCVTFKKVATVSLALSLAACSSPQKPRPVLMGKIMAPKSTCTIKENKANKKNPLAPFKAIEQNATINAEHNQTTEIGGDVTPVKIPEPLLGVPVMPTSDKILKKK